MQRGPGIGTYEWCEHFGARLNRREKAEVLAMLARAQLRNFSEQVLFLMGSYGSVLDRVDLAKIAVPDSAVARNAERYAEESYSSPLLLHVYRTFFWGSLLGQGDGLRFDPELLFVASLLHDLGISERNAARTDEFCFAATGAREACEFVLAEGWDRERAIRAYEAVSLHLNPFVDASQHGAEAKLEGRSDDGCPGREASPCSVGRDSAGPRQVPSEVFPRRDPRHGTRTTRARLEAALLVAAGLRRPRGP